MCGLAGYLNGRCDQTADQMRSIVVRMADTLRHRGPDDAGAWCDPQSGIALGHRRLSIVDLSPAGHQPMTSRCGRFIISYNGEVYNHDQLRHRLIDLGHQFHGHSDTEVLVEGFSEWGIEATIRQCVGMFAIATWDLERRELTLIRDRLGKKPLYYGQFGSSWLFGSELKSLRAHPEFDAEIDRDALAGYLRWSYLRHPATIYRRVKMLPPGTSLTIRSENQLADPTSYWSLTQIARAGAKHSLELAQESFATSAAQLDSLLTEAVGCRMVADVPLGAFLSGGIDSSLIVALMQKQSSLPVKTFTIGFEQPAYNEAPFAAKVAKHLKTDHTELYVTSAQARDVIPLLPTMFDEPFADSSQIPTYLLCQLARRHVTVALSGDGGDELFCGYRRYFEAFDTFTGHYSSLSSPSIPNHMISRLRRLPAVFGTAIRGILCGLGRLPLGRIARRLDQLSNVLGDTHPIDRYFRNLSHWSYPEEVVLGASMNRPIDLDATQFPNLQQLFQCYDSCSYLPDDILTKVDRASMAVSLEARTPLLDHRIVEFAWNLNHKFLVRGTVGKLILREVLSKYVPRELWERPKVGFGVPINEWLRGPLRDWAEDLLDRGRLIQEGFFDPKPIRDKWSQHLSGRADWHYLLWDVLMFQTWLNQQSSD